MTTDSNKRKLLITGTHGFVGARALEKYPEAIVLPPALAREPDGRLLDFVEEHRPQIILNAAAISDIRACEQAPEASYTANVTLPVLLARGAERIGAKLVSFSTDQVYTGLSMSGPYREDTALPPPANVYARHKLEAEQRVLEISPAAVLLRATWMYDMPLYAHANRANLMTNVLRSLIRREKMVFSDRQYRGVTYVRQVVELLDGVFSLDGGVYNYGSENDRSMYDTAVALFEALGAKEAARELLARPPADVPPPHDLWMDGTKLREHGIAFDSTVEGFRRCAREYLYFTKE